MPVYEQGYRHWEGRLSGHALRWWTITATGVRQAVSDKKMWIFLGVAQLPAVGMAVGAYGILNFGDVAARRGVSADAVLQQMIERFGPTFFFQLVKAQVFFLMLLCAGVGAGLIARDRETHALEIYLSKPVRKIDYVLGKFGVIALLGLAVTLVPFLLLYAVVALCQSDLSYVRQTFRIPLGLAAFAGLASLVCGWLILGLSSLTSRHRYVSVGWVGFYFVSLAVGGILGEAAHEPRFQLLAFGRDLERIAGALLGASGEEAFAFPWTLAGVILGGLAALGFVLVYLRVRAVEVVRG